MAGRGDFCDYAISLTSTTASHRSRHELKTIHPSVTQSIRRRGDASSSSSTSIWDPLDTCCLNPGVNPGCRPVLLARESSIGALGTEVFIGAWGKAPIGDLGTKFVPQISYTRPLSQQNPPTQSPSRESGGQSPPKAEAHIAFLQEKLGQTGS